MSLRKFFLGIHCRKDIYFLPGILQKCFQMLAISFFELCSFKPNGIQKKLRLGFLPKMARFLDFQYIILIDFLKEFGKIKVDIFYLPFYV